MQRVNPRKRSLEFLNIGLHRMKNIKIRRLDYSERKGTSPSAPYSGSRDYPVQFPETHILGERK